MIRDRLKMKELLKVKSIVHSVKPEHMPFFLSTLISKMNTLDALTTKVYPSEEEENKNALKTIDDFEKLINTPFSSEVKSKAIDLFKETREYRIEDFSKFIHTHSTLYTFKKVKDVNNIRNHIIKQNDLVDKYRVYSKKHSSGKSIDSKEGNVR